MTVSNRVVPWVERPSRMGRKGGIIDLRGRGIVFDIVG
jgi:hypothetical protein